MADGPSYDELASRLDVAEQTLTAIMRGEVDGLVAEVDGVAQVFTLEGSDGFYRALVEQMPEGAAAVTVEGTVLYANSSLAQLLGVPPEQLPATGLLGHVAPSDRSALARLLRAPGRGPALEMLLRRPMGDDVPVSMSVRALPGTTGDVRCLVAVDLTSRRTAEEQLRAAEARFRGAFDAAPIGMALLDLHGRVEQANAALCELVGVPAQELVGHPLTWLRGDEAEAAVSSVAEGVQERASVAAQAPGAAFVSLELSALRVEGRPRHLIVQVQDESERHRHEAELRHLADHDQLTGLPNRRGFDQALARGLEHERRYQRNGSLLLLDIDHFKYVNDTRGHHVGDELLVEMASALRARLRDSDVLARLGGDEFAVLLPQGNPLTVAGHLLDAARSLRLNSLAGRRVTVSIGITPLTAAGGDSAELLALADVALYDSKEAGRDRVTLVPSRGAGTSPHGARLTWLQRIEDALARRGLLLEAQPIIDLSAGTATQAELLVRLPSPAGPVAAYEWFPTAERCGLALGIDEWVLEQAFTLLADDRYTSLNVNVSATSLTRPQWREGVVRGLQHTQVDPARLTFEITETAAIGNLSAAIRFTESLRKLGCRLALDDFGAGFASFYYLKHLPFDDVKIDGEFVRSCVDDERDRSIIRAMVDVARSTGRRTVAECVEDAATLELVRAQHVDLAQGWFLGRPELVEL